MSDDKKEKLEYDKQQELYKAKASGSFSVFMLLAIVIVILILAFLAFFIANFANS